MWETKGVMLSLNMELLAMVIMMRWVADVGIPQPPARPKRRANKKPQGRKELCTKQRPFEVDGLRGLQGSKCSKDSKEL